MLRYWYKLNNDVQNYGMGNEKFVEGGTYGGDYPKLFYKNLLIYAGKNAANIPAGDDLVYTLTETLTKYSISVWYYVHSSHTNHGNNVHMIKLINGTNYSYIDQFWNPQSAPQWRHLCLTYDGQNQNIYINGVLKEQTNFSKGQITSLRFMDKDEVKGGLTDLKIFDHVLSNKEIEELTKPLLVHLPFNYICVPSVILSNYIPGQEYVNYISTLTKDSSVKTGSLPNIPKEWIMQHLGETICASAYVYSLGSYTAGTAYGRFGIHYHLEYIATDNTSKKIDPLLMFTPGQNGLYYSTWTIPSNIKSCSTDLIVNNHTLGIQYNAKYGASPDQYGVTWTFSHFKIELGNYPTSPLGNPQLVQDTSGHNYQGTIIGSIKSCRNTPRYDKGISITGNNRIVINDITITGTVTISYWVRLHENHTQYAVIIGDSAATSVNSHFRISHNSDNRAICVFYPNTLGSQSYHYSNSAVGKLNFNEWYHVVISFENLQVDTPIMKYAINGISYTNEAIEGTNGPSEEIQLSIGQAFASATHNPNFDISDFRIYKTALSDQQIKDLYNESAVIDNNGNILTYELNEL